MRAAQLAAAHALSAHFFARKDPAIVVMPTGSGKSLVMAMVAFLLRAQRILALTPSRMVRDQLGEAFSGLALLRSVGVLDDGAPLPKVHVLEGRPSTVSTWEALRDFDVVVGTVQCASPAIEGVAQAPQDLFDLILCDEAHHEPAPTWRALLDHFSASRKALFTATPFRRDDKSLRGRIVFDYPLARAREDGVFGRLEYVAVEPSAGTTADVALARAADAQIRESRSKSLRDLVMVRTAQQSRAEFLEDLYAKETTLRLRTVLGRHSQRRVRSTLKAMRAGELDGVICVDMLGEGFDLPELKLAVLHSPHKSLAVTLQFIGRFARTNAPSTGNARFLAVPSEIASEAQPLYVVGAEWNEIVEEASRRRIDAEREAREVLGTFQPPPASPEATPADSGEEIDLASIVPYFHVKVLEAPDGVDLDKPFEAPVEGEPILLQRSDEHHALVCVTRDVSPCRWATDDRLVDVNHDLFILFFDEDSGLLFICSSRREMAVYDAIVEEMVRGAARRLSPEELNRVLRGIESPAFFSVGMRNRASFGYGESYRMITGKAADKAIQKADGRFYDRGHCFGRGADEGATVTIGFSSASKVWANKWGNLPSLFAWCRKLGGKLADDRAVKTRSGLDNLPLARRATEFPSHIVAVDWHEEVYKRTGLALGLVGDTVLATPIPLLDLTMRVASAAKDQVVFVIEGTGVAITIEYRLDRHRWFSAPDGDATCGDAEGRRPVSLLDFFHDYPPAFFSADLSRLEGDAISSPPTDMDDVFDVSSIEEVDWSGAGVDPLLEKPSGGPKQSIFDWVQARLLATDAEVVFNDDGPGEVADFVSLTARPGGSTHAVLYHCKAALRNPVPGTRVEDLYEVTGQAVKSVRFASPELLRSHLLRRLTTTAEGARRLLKGNKHDVERLLADEVQASVSIAIVQPGIGRRVSAAQSSLLASANAYLVAGQLASLRVLGSVAAGE